MDTFQSGKGAINNHTGTTHLNLHPPGQMRGIVTVIRERGTEKEESLGYQAWRAEENTEFGKDVQVEGSGAKHRAERLKEEFAPLNCQTFWFLRRELCLN